MINRANGKFERQHVADGSIDYLVEQGVGLKKSRNDKSKLHVCCMSCLKIKEVTFWFHERVENSFDMKPNTAGLNSLCSIWRLSWCFFCSNQDQKVVSDNSCLLVSKQLSMKSINRLEKLQSIFEIIGKLEIKKETTLFQRIWWV